MVGTTGPLVLAFTNLGGSDTASSEQKRQVVGPSPKTPHKTSTQPLHSTFGLEEQHSKRKMSTEKRGANYSFTAGWPETNLIIIIVKTAQRKPAAFPCFHRNPIERLLVLVMIYKVTSQTDLL